MCRLYKKKRIFAKQIKHINIMAKTLRILFLGLAIVLSGTAMAQNKSAGRNVRNDKVMRLKNGRQKPAKKAKKAPLFTKTTTVFSEDFSNGLDTAWRTYDQDGDGWNWFYDPYSTAMLPYSYDTDNYNPITPQRPKTNDRLCPVTTNAPSTTTQIRDLPATTPRPVCTVTNANEKIRK